MTKSYFTHLGTVFLIHGFLLLGTLQLSKTSYVQEQIGTNILKLQVATSVLMNEPQVKKKVVNTPALQPKVTTTPIVEEVPVAETTTVEQQVQSSGKSDILSLYKAELRAMIDKNKYYPPMSRRLGQTGTVVVSFTLLEDGNIIDVRIDRPSRYERLNESAIDAVKKVERFRPIPKELGEARMDIKVPVKFFTI